MGSADPTNEKAAKSAKNWVIPVTKQCKNGAQVWEADDYRFCFPSSILLHAMSTQKQRPAQRQHSTGKKTPKPRRTPHTVHKERINDIGLS